MKQKPTRKGTTSSTMDGLTKAQWKELQLTGCVVVGDRIIRTAAFVKRVHEGARKDIAQQAKRLFGA